VKSLKITALVSALALSLSGCAGGAASLIPEEKVSTIGLSGTDLSSVVKFADMNVDDQLMFWSCRQLNSYLTDTAVDDSGKVDSLNAGEGKSMLRDIGLHQLEMLVGDYPEVQIYIDGVTQELALGDGQDKGFQSFKKLCKTYDLVQKNVQAHYVEPITLQAGCWDSGKIKATLQESVNGTWVTLGIAARLQKTDFCTGKYRWGYGFVESRADVDSTRTVRVVYVSTIGQTLGGKKKWITSSATFSSTDTGPISVY
jgi:hypothetical protein